MKDTFCTYYWRIVDNKDKELANGDSKSFSYTFQLPILYSVYATACLEGVYCDNAWIGISPHPR